MFMVLRLRVRQDQTGQTRFDVTVQGKYELQLLGLSARRLWGHPPALSARKSMALCLPCAYLRPESNFK